VLGFMLGQKRKLWRLNPEIKMTEITMRDLLKAGVHFGHKTRFWNPEMSEYIFGERQNIHIINLEKTLPMFRKAVEFLGNVAANRGRVLFVGTKFAASDVVREQAQSCGMPYVDHRWLGGMLTNFKTIRQSIRRLKDLESLSEVKLAAMTKKEVLTMERERTKLARSLSGIKNMGGLPDAVFVIDTKHEHIAIKEANRLGIPVVAVVDTNSSSEGVDYIIPGNDDAMRAITFYCSTVAAAIEKGRAPLLAEEAKSAAAKAVVKKRAVTKTAAPKADVDAKAESEEKPAAKVKTVAKAKAKVKTVRKVAADSGAEKPAAKAKPAAKTASKAKPAAKASTKAAEEKAEK
jgi:small subunit ribosomal protein S2